MKGHKIHRIIFNNKIIICQCVSEVGTFSQAEAHAALKRNRKHEQEIKIDADEDRQVDCKERVLRGRAREVKRAL